MVKKKKIIFTLMFLFCLAFAFGNCMNYVFADDIQPVNYYVSPTGSDSNDGLSPKTPMLNPQTASNLTHPGDTVYFMGGKYTYSGTDRLLTINNPGTADKYITYKPYNNEKPILTVTKGWGHIDIRASYIIVDGITVVGNNDNLTLKDGTDMYDYVVKSTQDGTPIDYGKVSTTNTNGITIDSRTNRVATGAPTIHNIIVRNCDVSKCSGGGISALEGDYITIENNKVYDNMWYSMYAGSGLSLLTSIDVDNNTGYKCFVRNNLVYGNGTKGVKWISIHAISDGNGIIIDSNNNDGKIGFDGKPIPPYAGKTLVANNISYGNGGSGLHVFDSSNVDVINNTIYDNNKTPELQWSNMFANSAEHVNFFNNIVYAGANGLINKTPPDETVIYANNIYFGGTPAYMGPGDRNIDPKFVDLAAKNFELQSDSPAIDQGLKTFAPLYDINGSARPQGAGFDIGAYESPYTSLNPLINNELDPNLLKPFVPASAEAAFGTPIIDGNVDGIWANTESFTTSQQISSTLADKTIKGAKATVKVMWDDKNIYALAQVTDSSLSKNSPIPYFQDSAEFFIDENDAKTKTYETNDSDGQYRVNLDNEKSGKTAIMATQFTSATIRTATGYNVEFKMPLRTGNPYIGKMIGFDCGINDDPDGLGNRIVNIWSDTYGQGYNNTSKWGNIKLVQTLHDDTAKTVAQGITTLVAPAKDATQLIMPIVAKGYTIAIKSAVSTPTTIALNNTIAPPVVDTTVAVVFTVTKESDNSSADTASINVIVPAKTHSSNILGIPGKPLLVDNNGQDTGLKGGTYNITMNMWWGVNASQYKLYEDGVLIDAKTLTPNSLNAQTVVTSISGKQNGTHKYYCELINDNNITTSDILTVNVTDALPGKLVLSSDNWDGDGNYKLNTNMWWGTNGKDYKLYENGLLIDTQTLNVKTPQAQQAVTTISGRKIGTYNYYCEFINEAGVTTSNSITVKVIK